MGLLSPFIQFKLFRFLFYSLFTLFIYQSLEVASSLLTLYTYQKLNPGVTAFMEKDYHSCDFFKPCILKNEWVDLKNISIHLQEAVLVSEDDRFFDHEGIDTEAIEKSIELNLKKKKYVRGGSTLSQQIIKNLFLSSEKHLSRKVKEIILTLLMEKILDKERILEIYLNKIEWGPHIYGAEAASQYYFKKNASELSASEAAYLAAMIPNPKFLTSEKQAGHLKRRQMIILKRMSRRSFEELE